MHHLHKNAHLHFVFCLNTDTYMTRMHGQLIMKIKIIAILLYTISVFLKEQKNSSIRNKTTILVLNTKRKQ